MSGNWQHKILQHEIVPPTEVWGKITDQLDEEYHPEETIISKKMYDYEISPPVFMLDRILDGLVSDQLPRPKAKVVSFPFSRAAIAAVAVGLVAITLIYFVRPGSSSETQSSAATVIPSVPRSKAGTPSLPDNDAITRGNTPPENKISPTSDPVDKKADQPGNDISRTNRNIERASLSPVLAANTISPISVSAPPIYDGDGNIIMDEDLVSAPNENYIIVTSPNGEQTKISRKFLKMLCVMNGGTDNYYMNAENFEWKLRFEEWRSKLLQQASYIPTANNFLDIMDLKELLQEN
jgi:hypothetical protein